MEDTEGVFVAEAVAEEVPVEEEEVEADLEGVAEAVEEEEGVPVLEVVEEVVAEEECEDERVKILSVPEGRGEEEEEAVAEDDPVEEEDWLGEAVTLDVAVELGEALAEFDVALNPFSSKEHVGPPSHGERHCTEKK